MNDASLTLSPNESICVNFYNRKIGGNVNIWKKSDELLSVSISIKGVEVFVAHVEVDGRIVVIKEFK